MLSAAHNYVHYIFNIQVSIRVNITGLLRKSALAWRKLLTFSRRRDPNDSTMYLTNYRRKFPTSCCEVSIFLLSKDHSLRCNGKQQPRIGGEERICQRSSLPSNCTAESAPVSTANEFCAVNHVAVKRSSSRKGWGLSQMLSIYFRTHNLPAKWKKQQMQRKTFCNCRQANVQR